MSYSLEKRKLFKTTSLINDEDSLANCCNNSAKPSQELNLYLKNGRITNVEF